ncbi:MAG: PilZ domain-containing protein [Nitrospira sp.]|nr:PilZ domain-containing protein [Nitrospira sp.]
MDRILNRFRVFPFRCQLCTSRFRVFRSQSPSPPSATDRREYKRLPVSFRANLLADNAVQTTNRVTDISMGGCTLETAATLPQGTLSSWSSNRLPMRNRLRLKRRWSARQGQDQWVSDSSKWSRPIRIASVRSF